MDVHDLPRVARLAQHHGFGRVDHQHLFALHDVDRAFAGHPGEIAGCLSGTVSEHDHRGLQERGIALGVVLISRAPTGKAVNLDSYLFGSVTSTSSTDVITFAVLSFAVLAVTVGFGRYLLAAGVDERYAKAAGLPVVPANLALAVTTAVTVVVSMRVDGLLLISALMVVPVVAAQQLVSGFWRTMAVASLIGALASVVGVFGAYEADTPSGATIVLITISIFAIALVANSLRSSLATRRTRRLLRGETDRVS